MGEMVAVILIIKWRSSLTVIWRKPVRREGCDPAAVVSWMQRSRKPSGLSGKRTLGGHLPMSPASWVARAKPDTTMAGRENGRPSMVGDQ